MMACEAGFVGSGLVGAGAAQARAARGVDVARARGGAAVAVPRVSRARLMMTTTSKPELDVQKQQLDVKELARGIERSQLSYRDVDCDKWSIELLYDGACSLCTAEANFLMKRDTGRGNIKFVDISSIEYDASEHHNVSYEQAMGRLHAIKRDGTIITGIDVFRETYAAIGLLWVYHLMQNPVVGWMAERAYDIWAENRLRITGRGELADIIRERERLLEEKNESECEDTCNIDW
ncbi:Uncharacterized protein FVE85_1009 [Porphyridium purpureum]|uniref:Thiol-disulfide oxidoreductase DCC n=1 Tax=Porphyridium purpureum TaxID=35688 RepID=A0A5J4Z1X5_PORPP|nr:Uncharacterized protein FVE85_1009 [Porphyridium purpureum]|eukprot:POR7196..scf208_2